MTAIDPSGTLLDLARQGNPRPAISDGLRMLADGTPVGRIIQDVLAPVQRQVGVLWETNEWQTADEHAATAVIDGVLGALSLETIPPVVPRGQAIVACAEGEHHTMPARMGVELLRAEGWEVTFLGGSLPADDLQRFVARREPDAVVVSCTVPLFLAGARRCFGPVEALGVPTFAAGAAFGDDARRAIRLGARGWLGASVDLGELLAGTSQVEPRATPPPREALALELDRSAVEEAGFSLIAEQVPAMASYSPAQASSTRRDLSHIVGFLIVSLDLAEDQIFTSFLAWLSEVLGTRGIPASDLRASLRCLGDVLEARGLPHAASLCAP